VSTLHSRRADPFQLTPVLRLVRELGKGGMGHVWVADHATLRTQVAVKLLAERTAGRPDAISRFSAEAAAAARIRSPHVVQVFDHGFAGGVPYIVMELLEGEDLAHRLERERRLPVAEVVTIVRQLCKALEKAHALGVVHRDVKPANVFLVSGMDGPFVKVLDFGLAKHEDGALGDLTDSHSVFGTPHYVSPEQAQSARTATRQSDLWSVAVIAYECLTGTRPFEAESIMGLCLALNTGKFRPPTALRLELPSALDAWFARAFQRAPVARFGSATELASTFAAALENAPAHPPLPRRRRRVVVAGAAIGGALLGLAGWVGFRSWQGARPVATASAVASPMPAEVAGVPSVGDTAVASPPPAASPPAASPAASSTVPAAISGTHVLPESTKRAGLPRAVPWVPPPTARPSDDDLFNDPKPRP
jgi:serine/threonine-protein kinase